MKFPHTLYFIRHGETDWNRAGRLQGQTETDLNALGRSQAARNGETLSAYLDHIGARAESIPFVASPMKRTRQTAEIVLKELRLSPDQYPTDERLKEISFGEFEGLTPLEIKERRAAEHRARKDDRWRVAAPGGESYSQLSERVGSWLETIDTDTIVIAHGGISRVVRGHLLSLTPEEIVSLSVPQDKIMVIGEKRIDWL